MEDCKLEALLYSAMGFSVNTPKFDKTTEEVISRAMDIYADQKNHDILKPLKELGLLDTSGVREKNAGASNYAKHLIQPWSIWIDYKPNPFDADIIKRVLRTKKGEPRKLDYEKIIHVCQERIRQLEEGLE